MIMKGILIKRIKTFNIVITKFLNVLKQINIISRKADSKERMKLSLFIGMMKMFSQKIEKYYVNNLNINIK